MRHTVVLIPGDGIGPEVAQAARFVLKEAGAKIDWLERQAGVAAVEQGSAETLPLETIEAVQEHRVALKGPCTTPIGEGFTSVNVASGECLDVHHFAVLIGVGATTVNASTKAPAISFCFTLTVTNPLCGLTGSYPHPSAFRPPGGPYIKQVPLVSGYIVLRSLSENKFTKRPQKI